MKKPEIVAMSTGDVYAGQITQMGADQFLKKDAVVKLLVQVQHRSVVLVDDKEYLREIAHDFVPPTNALHTYASAVTALAEIPHLDPPVDLVITDLLMPEMNGWVFIQELIRLYSAMDTDERVPVS